MRGQPGGRAHGGLKVAVRTVDPDRIQEAVRRSMVGVGRIDATFSADGLPLNHVGISEYADIVGKLNGRLSSEELAIGGVRTVRIHGAAGLRLPIPTDSDRLVACNRAIAEVCATKPPHERLAFIEEIQPVGDGVILGRLDQLLEQVLGRTATAPLSRVHVAKSLQTQYNIEIEVIGIRAKKS